MRHYKNFKMWKDSVALTVKIIKNCKAFPKENRFDLTSQIIRASISIPSNIAEGSSRRSERDFYRFLEKAYGSANELETQLIIAKLCDFGVAEDLDICLNDLTELRMMISGFMRRLAES